MVKSKPCLFRAAMFIPLLSMLCFSQVSAASDKMVGAIEKDLLQVVALLDKDSKAILKAPNRSSVGSSIKLVANQTSISSGEIDLGALENLDLSSYTKKSKKTSKKKSKKRTRKSIRLSKKTYRSVMTSKKRRSYRPCYKYGYNELQSRSRRYQHSITEASRLHGVNENLIKSVITAESCFKVKAKSHKGARGLMQLMPATARRFGVRNSYNSHQNIGAGARYLRWLLDRYKGNVRFALAGYNAGEGKVDRYGGIPPYKETREYVKRVMGVYKTLHSKSNYSYSNGYVKPRARLQKTRADYQRIWQQQQRVKQQNRPLSDRRCIEAAPSHLNRLTSLKRSGRGGRIWRRYYNLRQYENLAHVMNKTGVHINVIKRMNHLNSRSTLSTGKKLLVWECRA